MQTLTLEENTVRQTALVIPFPIAHVLARAIEHDGEIAAFRRTLAEITHNTAALRATRIRAAQQMLALETVVAEIAKYLPTR